METFEGVKTFYAKSRKEWRKWLTQYSETEKRVYLIVYHKKSGKPSVGFQEAIDEAICFGWIDSKGKRRDQNSSYWCFSKRNPKSTWGKTSRERAAHLIQSGLMTDQGLAMIELAKRTGTWEAYPDAENLIVPFDLQQQLKENPEAQTNFESFAPSSKRIVLQWIAAAKRAETRQRRIKQTVDLAEENQIAGLPKGMRENRSKRTTHRLRTPKVRKNGRGLTRRPPKDGRFASCSRPAQLQKLGISFDHCRSGGWRAADAQLLGARGAHKRRSFVSGTCNQQPIPISITKL